MIILSVNEFLDYPSTKYVFREQTSQLIFCQIRHFIDGFKPRKLKLFVEFFWYNLINLQMV